MATHDDAPNFAYAYGNAVWNPALRPDSIEPQEASIFSAPPLKEESVVIRPPSSEQHGSLPPAGSHSHAPALTSLASNDGLEDHKPPADNDFFDRYGFVAEDLAHQESIHADVTGGTDVGLASEQEKVRTRGTVEGLDPSPQSDAPAVHAQDLEGYPEELPAGHALEQGCDFQAGSTFQEDARQESSTTPLVADTDPTNIDWGNIDDSFDIGAGKEHTAASIAPLGLSSDATSSGLSKETGEPTGRMSTAAAQDVSDLHWGTLENHDFDLGDSPAAVAPTVDVSTDATSAKPDAPSQADDLSALWQAALGDDDLLVEPNNDSWTAFDDGEGFLDDTTEQASGSTQIPSTQASGVSIAADTVTSKQNRYAPSNAQQPATAPTNQILPNRPQFTDFSQLNQPAAAAGAPAVSPYQMAHAQQPPRRPAAPSSAESFAAKSKGGYHSPYDLPEDLTKPRRRLIHHTPSMPSLQSMQPPPRSTSIPSSPAIGPPRPQPPPSMAPRDLTPPSSSHSSQGPNEISATKTASPTKPADGRGSSEFFADLPEVRRTRHHATSGRYTSVPPAVQTPPLNQGPPAAVRPAAPSLANQLRQPERMPLYGDDQPIVTRAVTMPAPPSSRYSPPVTAGAPVAKNRYSPAPTAAPPTATRYSPAPTVGASHQSYAPQVSAPAKAPNQLYAPRTSSPLAYSSSPQQHQPVQPPVTETGEPMTAAQESAVHGRSSIDRATSITGHIPLEPVSEDGPFVPTPPSQVEPPAYAASTMSTRSATPPLAGQRSGPPSAVGSPRKRTNYVPQPSSAAPTSDPGFAPPPRSNTTSPGKVLKQSQLRMMSFDRPASAHSHLPGARDFTTLAVIQPPSQRPSVSHDANLIPPQGELAHDPLQRWKGSPIFKWANGGIVVTCFPQHVPRYGSGFLGPAIQPMSGEVKTRSAKDVFLQSDLFAKFPGPLKKGRKKDVLVWLKAAVEELEKQIQTFNMQSGLPEADVRMEEKVLLWKFVSVLVENDGVLEGKPGVEEAVRKLLSVAPPVDEALSSWLLNGSQSSTTGLPDAFDPNALSTLRTHLYHGDREKAVWHAADQRLWAHALLIASTQPTEIWKQVVQEFVRKEIRKASDNNEPIAALYQVFAGNWEESIDELVPVSARAGFQMVSTHGNGTPKDALAGLDKWRETLLLVLNNRSPNDVRALLSLGKLLRGYGRTEAAHVCFLFARSVTYFGGEDDPQADFTLLGGNPFMQGSDLGRDLDSVLLSEVYEFALTLSSTPTTPIPHLQPYKLYHAEVLAEAGYRNEAQQYCDAIASTIHSKTKPSPYFNGFLMQRLDDLSKRLSQAPVDGSSWKPSMDKVSSSLWGKFNSFVTGEDSDAASNASATGQGGDSGNFIRMLGDTPDISRQASNTDLYGAMMSNGNPPAAPVNARYAPGNASPSRTSLEKPANSRYAPQAQVGYQPRTSVESLRSAYEPSPGSGNSFGLSASPQKATNYNAPTSHPTFTLSFEPPATSSAPPVLPIDTTFSQPSNTPSSYQPNLPVESLEVPSLQRTQQSLDGYQDASGPSHVPQPASFDSYEPPTSTYEPPVSDEPQAQSSYEPPSYQTYEPSATAEEPQAESPIDDSAPKPKKKSFMDDDDDDDELMKRAEALKKQKHAEADRLADDAFRKAAEADAVKPPAATEKKGWFGGWFKKDPNAPTGPIKAKLGEENSFVFDKELGKWVNKKAGAASATPAAATPPPPRVSPRPSSALGVPNGAPPTSVPPTGGSPLPPPGAGAPPPMASRAASVPPPMMARTDSQGSSGSAPAGSAGTTGRPPPSGPPSRPTTSMGNGSDLDDLLGVPTGAPRKGGKKGTQRKGRYVDVMANQK